MHARMITDHRVRAAVAALIFASGLSLAMLAGRAVFFRRQEWGFYVWNLILTAFQSAGPDAANQQLGFYVWNLFLAWLPLLFALRAYHLAALRPIRWWPLAICAGLWFLFFPNAPYIVTDFLHLKGRPPVPPWFDIVIMMSFAWTGLLIGYLSLLLMQETVRIRCGRAWGWCFAVAMLALGSFGIYLGRFARWNSWDVIARPHGLAGDVYHRMDFKSNPEMFAFLLTFLCFSLLSYATLHALACLHHPAPPPEDAPAAS